MIDLTARRNVGANRTLKVIGVGGGGCNALDRMVLDGVNPAHLVAVHTDAQTLTASVAGEKIQLGQTSTRGFGSGGDPDLGRQAAEESVHALQQVLDGNDAIFLLAGLGGGTASGAVPLIGEWAKEAGAMVIAVVTLPFEFEGKRRQAQALEALTSLERAADAVICFENDRMADHVAPNAGIGQAFTLADHTLSQSIQAVSALFYRKGFIHLGFDDLKAALGGIHGGASARTLFGYGEASGDNRAFEALNKALKNPLMNKGRVLHECSTVLIQISGGPEMLLNEVQLLMEEFNRKVEWQTRILFGTAVDPQLAGKIAVTIMASLSAPGAIQLPEPKALTTHVIPAIATPVVSREVAPVLAAEGPQEAPMEEPVFMSADDSAELEAEEELVRFDEPVAEAPEVYFSEALEAEEEPEADSEEEEELVVFDQAHAEPLGDQEPEVETEIEAVLDETPEATPDGDEVETAEGAEEPEQPSLFADEAAAPHPFATPRRNKDEAPQHPFAQPRPLGAATSPFSTRSRIQRLMTGKSAASAEEVAPRSEAPAPQSQALPVPAAAPATPVPSQEPLAAPAPSASPVVAQAATPLVAPAAPAVPTAAATAKAPQQETLKFESANRGRFEKSEPTIVDGQDLDVPTFLRRNIRIR